MTPTPASKPFRRHQRGRGRSPGSARPLLRVLVVAMSLALLAGCAREEAPPPELSDWPVASAPGLLGLSTEIAWVSPARRAQLQVMGRQRPLSVPGQVCAVCRVPAMDYAMPADAPLRFGFLVFHDSGVSYAGGDAQDTTPAELTVDGALQCVRAATCVSPSEGNAGEVVALVTGGAVPPRTPAGEAEPPPWVTSADVQLAWLQGGRLIVGPPEQLTGKNPWALRSGKFAGEEDNLLVSVYTDAPFDTVVRRRPWIYRVVQGEDGLPRLDPRWRGTSFAHPFRDATFADVTGAGEGEIAALEVSEDGGRMLTAYRFEGFGLEGLGPSAQLPDVEDRLEAARWTGAAGQELVIRTLDGRFLFYALDGQSGQLRQVLDIEGPEAVLGWVITDASASQPGNLLCVLPDGDVWRVRSDDSDEQVARVR